jgi:CDP-diacylglycerol--glycerol-3-phosphate 3-phosphatidyltransferase
MISFLISRWTAPVRQGLARGLLRIGLRPNHITLLGMAVTVGAGVLVAAGKAWWPWAAGLIVVAGACDLLDGTMAKIGAGLSRFGGVLDSVCDRVSDAAIYLGAAAYFVAQPDGSAGSRPNLTLALLAGTGLVVAYLTSYIRARAEKGISFCGGGFWQRGERVVTVLLGLAFGHLATAVWILGLWPITTVAHRLWRAGRTAPSSEGQAVPEPQGLAALLLWRWKRGTVAFDIHAGTVILLLIVLERFVGLESADPLRRLIAALGA